MTKNKKCIIVNLSRTSENPEVEWCEDAHGLIKKIKASKDKKTIEITFKDGKMLAEPLADIESYVVMDGDNKNAPIIPAKTKIDKIIKELKKQTNPDPHRFSRRFVKSIVRTSNPSLGSFVGYN